MIKNYIDWNDEWNYPLQWIYESEFARQIYSVLCFRVNLAIEGKPYKNLYKEEMLSLMKNLSEQEKQMLGSHCTCLPEGTSFKVLQCVNTVANQMATGVDSYEYQINDPYGFVKPETADLLAAKCSEDYVLNRLELMAPLFSKDLYRYGMVGVLVKYDPKTERNIIHRLRPQNMWWDTMFSVTGQARFVGYSTMIPYSTLKKMIVDDKDEINDTLRVPSHSAFSDDKKEIKKARYYDKKIKTLNDLDIYVDDMNRLAQSTQLQGFSNLWPEYMHDLGSCYNTGYYHTLATDPKAQTKSGYHGQDVELTVMYDLNRKIEFKIINRRFVISMNKKAFRRNIAFPIHNPLTEEVTERIEEVQLDCPLKFQFADMDTMDKFPHPTSPVMKVLDDHDELCALRAKRKHVSDILGTLRIETNGADANSLKKVMNVMGVILDDIQGDINNINLYANYSYDPIDSQIAHYEDSIKTTLNAYTEFDAMQAMGDRASAAESGMAIGAISQGLCAHQNILMALYADIARQNLMNRVIYSPRQEFPVNNLGQYGTLTAAQMALDAIITVRPKMALKVHEKMAAQSALQLLGTFNGQLPEHAIGYFMEKAMYGDVSRQLAATFVNPPGPSQAEIENAQLQAQNQANALLQNEQMYTDNPIPYEAQNLAENATPEEFEQVMTGISTPDDTEITDEELETGVVSDPNQALSQGLDMPQQDGAMASGLDFISPELGSSMANPSGFAG